jgi:cytochrome c
MRLTLAAALLIAAAPAFAEGDVEKGAKDFGRCKSCHLIANGDEMIARGGKTGPNLFGAVGRTVGSVEDFSYSDGMKAAHEAGVVWDEATLAEYIMDPTAWLKKVTGDDSARSKMTFRLKDSADVAAYLATFATPPAN